MATEDRRAAAIAAISERLAALRGDNANEHVGGIPWHEAPVPRRWHRCKVQTSGWFGLNRYGRCACGAVSRNGGPWIERNTRDR